MIKTTRTRKSLGLLAYAWPVLLTLMMTSIKTADTPRSEFWVAMPLLTLFLVLLVCKVVGAKSVATLFSIWMSNGVVTLIQAMDFLPGSLPGGAVSLVVLYLVGLVVLLLGTPYLFRVFARRYATEPLNKRQML